MAKFLCLDCFDVYDSEMLNDKFFDVYEGMCPKSNCNGRTICLDELMIPAITVLNKKGYSTKFCCSGHYPGYNQTYIMFEEYVEIPSLPNGFRFDNCEDNVVIRSNEPFSESCLRDFYKICDHIKSLTKWAEELPENEQFYFI